MYAREENLKRQSRFNSTLNSQLSILIEVALDAALGRLLKLAGDDLNLGDALGRGLPAC